MRWIAALRTAQKNSRRGAFYMRPQGVSRRERPGRIWNPPLHFVFAAGKNATFFIISYLLFFISDALRQPMLPFISR